MTANIFPLEKVSTFCIENFEILKIQMDENQEDNEDVISWRDEAKRLSKDYKFAAYATFLIFSPERELVHRIVGGCEADQFIALAKEGLEPNTQYETLVKKFTEKPNDKAIAIAMAAAAEKAYDRDMTAQAIESVINNSSADELLQDDILKRSEERRVGKEVGSRWLLNQESYKA